MGTSKFQLQIKAEQLAEHTLRITSNCNRYPKKYRFSLVDKMQNKSLGIYESITEANSANIRLYIHQRLELQTKAITYCNELLFYIEMSKRLGIINMESMEHWSKMVSDIRNMTIAWRNSEQNAYGIKPPSK